MQNFSKLLFTLLFAVLFQSLSLAQLTLPITFDNTGITYTFADFGGTATVVGADPINATNMVGITTKDATAQFWAGTTIGGGAMASPIPFTTANHKMTVRVYSPVVGASIKLKVEVAGQPTQSVETDALTTVANAWETLTFDFDTQSSGTAAFDPTYAYDMASIFFNFGVTGTTEVYYFDDVMMAPVMLSQIDLPVTFDVANTDYTMTDFGGTVTVVGADPMNATNMVGITTKDATAQFWAGTTMGTGGLGFANAIPFTATNHKMTARVYSPVVGASIKLKVEVAGQPTQSVETDALTTVANAWETLTFDFDTQSSGTAAFDPTYAYDMASIFFNFGVTGTTEVYYFDEVMMYAPTTPAQIDLPVTFDVANTDYTMTDFGGTVTVVGADPMNATNMVGITTKDATAQFWAGTTMGTGGLGFANAIPFTATNHKMTARVYSPVVGASIKLKVEVAGQPTQSVETDALTTVANAWETLTFDFDTQSSGTAAFDPTYAYDMASIFFNFGVTGTTEVYYFDDVMMSVPTGLSQIDLPVTFDLTTVDYTMTDFGGNATVLGADPVNAANMVGITTKDATAQTWAGTTIGTPAGFASVIPFTATNRTMTVKVYSPVAGIPVRLKAEVHGQGAQSVETDAMTTLANTWETLTFDFNNNAAGTPGFDPTYPYDLASIFFNFGATGTTQTFYFDDVQMGSGGSTPLNQIDLTVTFEDTTVNYSVTDFGGNSTVLGIDPVVSGNHVAITTKGTGAQTWAGTTIGTSLGFANVIPFTVAERRMSVRVYSPDAGIPVRLKVEVHGQPTKSVETETLTTVANAWEEVVFDFNNQAAGTAAFDPTYPYDMASIFFNFGTDGATAGSKTYYWDDVKFGVTVGIEDPLASQVNFFPNPVSNILTVQLPEALRTDNITYQISDLTGRNVLNGTLDKAQIHVASLQEGMYILHLQTSNGVITKRFVKI